MVMMTTMITMDNLTFNRTENAKLKLKRGADTSSTRDLLTSLQVLYLGVPVQSIMVETPCWGGVDWGVLRACPLVSIVSAAISQFIIIFLHFKL